MLAPLVSRSQDPLPLEVIISYIFKGSNYLFALNRGVRGAQHRFEGCGLVGCSPSDFAVRIASELLRGYEV